jgi:hypothetical protein
MAHTYSIGHIKEQTVLIEKAIEEMNKHPLTGLYNDEIEQYGEKECFGIFQRFIVHANNVFMNFNSTLVNLNEEFDVFIREKVNSGFENEVVEMYSILELPLFSNIEMIVYKYKKMNLGKNFMKWNAFKTSRSLIHMKNVCAICPLDSNKFMENFMKKHKHESQKNVKHSFQNAKRDWRIGRRGKIRRFHNGNLPKKIIECKQNMQIDQKYKDWLEVNNIFMKLDMFSIINQFNRTLKHRLIAKSKQGDTFENEKSGMFFENIINDLICKDKTLFRENFRFVQSSKWNYRDKRIKKAHSGEFDIVVFYLDQIIAIGEMKFNYFDVSYGLTQHSNSAAGMEYLFINGKRYPINFSEIHVYVGTTINIYILGAASKIKSMLNDIRKISGKMSEFVPDDFETCVTLYHHIRDKHAKVGRPLSKSPHITLIENHDKIIVL